jgi:hypothetical protein
MQLRDIYVPKLRDKDEALGVREWYRKTCNSNERSITIGKVYDLSTVAVAFKILPAVLFVAFDLE